MSTMVWKASGMGVLGSCAVYQRLSYLEAQEGRDQEGRDEAASGRRRTWAFASTRTYRPATFANACRSPQRSRWRVTLAYGQIDQTSATSMTASANARGAS